jgi:hypothetical protein
LTPSQALLQCNTRFLRALESRVEPWHDTNCIGDCLLSLIGELDVYLQFVNMYDLAARRASPSCSCSNARFAAFCTAAQAHERSKRLDLRAYMIVPIQRIPRYVMLLADLVRSTSLAHDDASALHEAERRMREFADAMNQRKRERDADEANRQLAARFDALEFRLADPGRVLVQQGAVTQQHRLRRDGADRRAAARALPLLRHSAVRRAAQGRPLSLCLEGLARQLRR